MADCQAVLLGETHDVAEIHRWQLHVAVQLHTLRPDLAIGFEMFPRRVQPVLDRWVDGDLTTAAFLLEAEWDKVWGFDPALYLPLFHFCRQHRIPMLALNCQRDLVTRIGKDGWDAIPEAERDSLTPSAPWTDAYRAYLNSLMGNVASERFPNGVTDRFIRAQQVWDRAFACGIADALAKPNPPSLVIGIIGRGHLEYGHGTPAQLRSLDIHKIGVLLPNTAPTITLSPIADALFRLDEPEEPLGRPVR